MSLTGINHQSTSSLYPTLKELQQQLDQAQTQESGSASSLLTTTSLASSISSSVSSLQIIDQIILNAIAQSGSGSDSSSISTSTASLQDESYQSLSAKFLDAVVAAIKGEAAAKPGGTVAAATPESDQAQQAQQALQATLQASADALYSYISGSTGANASTGAAASGDVQQSAAFKNFIGQVNTAAAAYHKSLDGSDTSAASASAQAASNPLLQQLFSQLEGYGKDFANTVQDSARAFNTQSLLIKTYGASATD